MFPWVSKILILMMIGGLSIVTQVVYHEKYDFPDLFVTLKKIDRVTKLLSGSTTDDYFLLLKVIHIVLYISSSCSVQFLVKAIW